EGSGLLEIGVAKRPVALREIAGDGRKALAERKRRGDRNRNRHSLRRHLIIPPKTLFGQDERRMISIFMDLYETNRAATGWRGTRVAQTTARYRSALRDS